MSTKYINQKFIHLIGDSQITIDDLEFLNVKGKILYYETLKKVENNNFDYVLAYYVNRKFIKKLVRNKYIFITRY